MRTFARMAVKASTTAPATGELLLTGALLSLYVGLRGSAWAVGRLERITVGRATTAR